MAYCSSCGAKLVQNAKFCGGCGALVPETVHVSPSADLSMRQVDQDADDFGHVLGFAPVTPDPRQRAWAKPAAVAAGSVVIVGLLAVGLLLARGGGGASGAPGDASSSVDARPDVISLLGKIASAQREVDQSMKHFKPSPTSLLDLQRSATKLQKVMDGAVAQGQALTPNLDPAMATLVNDALKAHQRYAAALASLPSLGRISMADLSEVTDRSSAADLAYGSLDEQLAGAPTLNFAAADLAKVSASVKALVKDRGFMSTLESLVIASDPGRVSSVTLLLSRILSWLDLTVDSVTTTGGTGPHASNGQGRGRSASRQGRSAPPVAREVPCRHDH